MRGARDWLECAIPAAAAAVLGAIAARPRLLALEHELWRDEFLHNVYLVGMRGLREVCEHSYSTHQPCLEYALRKFLWFPLVGWSELALKAPSILSSMALFLLLSALAMRLFQGIRPWWLPPLAVALPVAWLGAHSTEIYYAGEARHYAFTALLSTAYVCTFVLFGHRRWLLAALGAVFCGTHFFALPLVGAALAFHLFTDGWRRAGRSWLPAQAALSFSLLLLSFTLGRAHAVRFPGNMPAGSFLQDPSLLLRRFVGLQGSFLDFWEIPFWLLLPAIGLLLARGIRERAAGHADSPTRRFFWLFIGSSAFFGAICLLSDYRFENRYFMPFFGIAAVFTLLVVKQLLALPLSPRFKAMAFSALLVPFCYRLALLPGAWELPPANFTFAYRFFERAKKSPAAKLFVLGPCDISLNLLYYWSLVGHPKLARPTGYLSGEANGALLPGRCMVTEPPFPQIPGESSDAYLSRFYAANPEVQTIFYEEAFRVLPTGLATSINVYNAGLILREDIRGVADFRADWASGRR